MKVPLSFLKEYIDVSLTPQEIASVLTLAGLEVDAIQSVGKTFSGVVVGEVLEAVQHPKADRLRVAKVSDGKEIFQVVCGAPNCRAGIKTAFAKVGATLLDKEGTFTIKKAKLRDVESCGMLCSAEELQLGVGDGIMELSSEWQTGTDLSSLYADEIFELSLTPNLGHCLSILGIARELSAHLNLPLKKKSRQAQEGGKQIEEWITVDLQDRKQCSRYAAKMVCEVHVAPSPAWLKSRVEACGVRSINNVVDIGNLVMLELGQPLHLFDYDKICGKKLHITSHTSFHQMKTLDGAEILIPPSALLITDEKEALALAGIMGGMGSMITDATKNVLIEAAHFNPGSIRKTTRLVGIKSASSQRFERGVDPEGTVDALEYAAYLLQQVASGKVQKGVVDVRTHAPVVKKVPCRTARVNALLGTTLSTSEVSTLLKRLSMQIVEEGTHQLMVAVPSFRTDITSEIDLVEEVARVYGYNHIPKKMPSQSTSALLNAPLYEMEQEARYFLLGQGLQEWMTCDLISPAQSEQSLMHGMSQESTVRVLQAHSVEQSVLRTTLLPGFLQTARYNIDRGNPHIAAFEVGRIHFKEKEDYLEPSVAAILLSGQASPYHFDPKPQESDFFDIKGIVENLLTSFSIPDVRIEPSHFHQLHPGRQMKIFSCDLLLGVAGEVHPVYALQQGIEQRLLFAQLNLNALLAIAPKEKRVRPLIPFPGSERDWTVTVQDHLPLETLLLAIKQVASTLLEKVFLLDLYKSSQIGEDKKNVTLRFFYRDKDKTLSLEDVEREHARIVKEVLLKL